MPVTISQVIHPVDGVVAMEVVTGDGSVYFATTDPFWQGLRVGAFPNANIDGQYVRLERREVARLEQQEGGDNGN